MLLLSLPEAAALAEALAAELQCAHAPLHAHRFPDGETLVRVDTPLDGARVVLVARLHRPDERTLPLLFAADAARDLGAVEVGLVAPYLPYMRQDNRFRRGEAVTSRSYARLLSRAFDFLVTVDPHLHRWHSLDEIYPIRTTVVAAAPAIAAWVRREVFQPLLVGPDSESAQWVSDVAGRLGVPWTVMTKERFGDRDVRVRLDAAIDWQGRTPVLLDDIVSSGHTMLEAVRLLRRAGWPPPTCVAVHALCEPAMLGTLAAEGVQRFVSCDTVPHPSNAIALAGLVADGVRRLAAR